MKKIDHLVLILVTLVLCASQFLSMPVICLNEPQTHLVLITGCGRSGTTYIAEVLTACGLQIGHEHPQKDGVASWLMAVDDPHPPWGASTTGLHFHHVFHQVRHPLQTIASITTFYDESWNYICKHIPQINIDDPILVRAAKYWLYWNLEAGKKAEWCYRIEDIDKVFPQMCRILDIPYQPEVLKSIPRDVNTREHKTLTWRALKKKIDPILFKKIQSLSKKYGYSTKDEEGEREAT